MKTKQKSSLALLILLLASACSAFEDKTAPTRAAVIQTAAPVYLTPENWSTVPQACVDSLIQVTAVSSDNERLGASGSLFYVQSAKNASGEYGYMYTFITANHFAEDTSIKMSSAIDITVNKAQELPESVRFSTTNLKRVVDDNGKEMDIILISVFGPRPTISINGSGPTPTSPENIISGMNIQSGAPEFFHILGYPKDAEGPRFNIVKVVDLEFEVHGYKTFIAETISDDFGATAEGNSGGPMCNNEGKIVGISTHHSRENYKHSTSAALPNNINQQIITMIEESRATLQMLGFIY